MLTARVQYVYSNRYCSLFQIIRDSESNTWHILSGSFDRSVKIWTQDIQLIHKIEGECISMGHHITGSHGIIHQS